MNGTETNAVQSVIIIGGGLAGQTTAKELRDNGFEGTVAIIDPEGFPYDRPPLSKDYLLGRRTATDIRLLPDQWYADHRVSVLTGRVESIEPDTGTVRLEDGSTHHGDRLVITTGGTARKLPIPGGDLPGIMQLRTKEDADRLRETVTPGSTLTIVGAGLIGAEVASAALELGANVTLIDPSDPPLASAVGDEIAQRLHRMHTDKGITVLTGVAQEVQAADGGGFAVELQGGEHIETDALLVGVGIVPRTEIAEAAGLEVANGIVVDETYRTSHPSIYAAGDVAIVKRADGSLPRRSEHWENAINAGKTVAASIMAKPVPAFSAPWFWSDRHGVHVEGVGKMSAAGKTVLRETGNGAVIAFKVAPSGELAGAAAIDGGLAVRAARRIIDKKTVIPPEKLADPSIDLKKLAK